MRKSSISKRASPKTKKFGGKAAHIDPFKQISNLKTNKIVSFFKKHTHTHTPHTHTHIVSFMGFWRVLLHTHTPTYVRKKKKKTRNSAIAPQRKGSWTVQNFFTFFFYPPRKNCATSQENSNEWTNRNEWTKKIQDERSGEFALSLSLFCLICFLFFFAQQFLFRGSCPSELFAILFWRVFVCVCVCVYVCVCSVSLCVFAFYIFLLIKDSFFFFPSWFFFFFFFFFLVDFFCVIGFLVCFLVDYSLFRQQQWKTPSPESTNRTINKSLS